MADLLDILTEAEAMRAALGVETGGVEHTTQVGRMNTAVSRRIDALCGPVVQRTVTEYHNGGTYLLLPRHAPVASVTTLREWNGSDLTTLTTDTFGVAANTNGYLLIQGDYAHSAQIIRRASGSNHSFPTGERTVELVYVAGRSATTADVDARFKETAAAIIRRLWKREGPIWAQSSDLLANLNSEGGPSPFFKAIDPMVAEFLADEMPPIGVA